MEFSTFLSGQEINQKVIVKLQKCNVLNEAKFLDKTKLIKIPTSTREIFLDRDIFSFTPDLSSREYTCSE